MNRDANAVRPKDVKTNTNEWITHRPPTEEEANNGYVWTSFDDNDVHVWPYRWEYIVLGMPWMPLQFPEPYIKPKRFVAKHFKKYGTWGVKDTHSIEPGLPNLFKTREDAERIAAIFEEVSP